MPEIAEVVTYGGDRYRVVIVDCERQTVCLARMGWSAERPTEFGPDPRNGPDVPWKNIKRGGK